ncbi:hypothetical protein ACIQ7D_26685 [Streptomyces sp. NPDC096310]|uniref:hypothetical protein n=1 Tax=Streptomyces sp. NPDC096310 TaxID=3366082 RepID=UPI003801E029
MEAELVALATAGATALIQQMATDGWSGARARVAGFLAARGWGSADSVGSDLDTARAELTAARREDDTEAVDDLHAEWRGRLRRTLRADPEAAAELRVLLDELSPGVASQQARDIHNEISGGTYHEPVIQAGMVDRIGTIGGRPFGSGGRGGAP